MKCFCNTTEFKFKDTAVTMGKFDGIHLGHQKLIEDIVKCKNQGLKSIVFTFSTEERDMLCDKKLIYTFEEKKRLLESYGIDIMISYPFTREVMSMTAEDFVKQILVEKLGVRKISIGTDFGFGYKRKGNKDLLDKLSVRYGYDITVFEKVKLKDREISSTLIREQLEEGNMEYANEMLGREYSISGEVVHGRQLGRTINAPTANLLPEKNKLLPKNGVYASTIEIKGIKYHGITNIGYKPTVGAEPRPGVETYIFNYDGNLYGDNITVSLCEFERGEKKFSSLDELKKQMKIDIVFSKEYFKNKNKE